MSGDATCKWCHAPIRWVRGDQRQMALDLAPVKTDGSWRVVGADTGIRIHKANRAKYPELYRPHRETCPKREQMEAFFRRQGHDRAVARRHYASQGESV